MGDQRQSGQLMCSLPLDTVTGWWYTFLNIMGDQRQSGQLMCSLPLDTVTGWCVHPSKYHV